MNANPPTKPTAHEYNQPSPDGPSQPPPGQNQRDPESPHRFTEAVVTLGEFKMAYRFDHVDELLWHYHYQPDTNLYLCQQNRHESEQQLLQDGF